MTKLNYELLAADFSIRNHGCGDMNKGLAADGKEFVLSLVHQGSDSYIKLTASRQHGGESDIVSLSWGTVLGVQEAAEMLCGLSETPGVTDVDNLMLIDSPLVRWLAEEETEERIHAVAEDGTRVVGGKYEVSEDTYWLIEKVLGTTALGQEHSEELLAGAAFVQLALDRDPVSLISWDSRHWGGAPTYMAYYGGRDAIGSRWLGDLLQETATEQTLAVAMVHLSSLVTATSVFYDATFGEPVFDLGFTRGTLI